MMKYVIPVTLSLGIIGPSSARAAEKTVTLAVQNMYCAACPHIVKSSMAAVPGVSTVTVSFAAKTATVTFDDAKSTTDTIAAASMNAGYPAHAKQQGG